MYGDCQFCAFWSGWRMGEDTKEIPDDRMGRCHRYAPRPYFTTGDDNSNEVWWPSTSTDQGCGDFIQRDEK